MARMDEIQVSAHEDPAGEAPWAMQLGVRVEKSCPPTHTEVCEAAATAVAVLLADPRAAAGGEWHPMVQRWLAGRIRKHTRRARGAAWDRAQHPDGVTVERGSAQVRAFVPGPVDQVPRDLARLQLSGLDLADPEPRRAVPVEPDGPVVVSLRATDRLTTGKAAAAAGHAAQLAAMAMDPARLEAWVAAGCTVAVEHVDATRWAQLCADAPVAVADAGYTEVEPGTVTATARWA